MPANKRTVPWYWLVICILVLCGVFFIYYYFSITNRPAAQEVQKEASGIPASTEAAEEKVGYEPIFGTVIIQNFLEEEVSRIEVEVVNGSWIVLPACFCFGGNRWIFQDQFGQEVRIKRGLWNQGYPVGIWQIEEEKEYNSLRLSPWNKSTALSWRSFSSESPARTIPIATPRERGFFTSFYLPGNIKEPGVFFQDDRIVGWTFGKWLKKGFLWNGPEGEPIQYNMLVSDFINSIFTNCQEAQFLKALAMGENTSAADRLFALAEGFRHEPQFMPEDKHEDLLPKTIIRSMHSLTIELLQNNLSQEVLDILDDQVLQKTSAPELLKTKTQAMISLYDHRRAVQYFERTKKILFPAGKQNTSGLEEFHAQLYKDWIAETIESERPTTGWTAYYTGSRAFPDSPELHLLGVELAISEKDWSRAEELLLKRTYPQRLMARTRTLEVLILEKKSEEGKVVIRFAPGAQAILVEAKLNGRKMQQFLVDTGATQVTIPSETARALGIQIDDDTPVVPVYTAAGVESAYEVEIGSIELKGLRVFNLKAFIIDIPGMPQLGLLGNNYLKNFHVEIDTTRGFLRLKRR